MSKRRPKLVPPTESPRVAGGWYYYVSLQWASILERLITPLYENYRWEWEDPSAAEQAKLWSTEIDRFKLSDLCPPATGGGGNGGGLMSGHDCVVFDGNIVNIDLRECPDMVVNIFFGCSCGGAGTCGSCTGGANGGSIGSGGSGGDGGSWIEEADVIRPFDGSVSDCEIVTGGFIDYAMDAGKEFWVTVANHAGAGIGLIEALYAAAETVSLGTITSDGWSWFKDVSTELADNTAALFVDNDFRNTVKSAWIKTYPNHGTWNNVTRAELSAIRKNLPYLQWEGLYPYGVKDIWWGTVRFLNMNKLNNYLPVISGDCDSGDYGWYYQNSGVGLLTPPAEGTYLPPVPFNYDWVYDFPLKLPTYPYSVLERGNLPDLAEGQWYANEGFGARLVGGKDALVGMQFPEQLTLQAVQITMDAPMTGDLNEFTWFEGDTDTAIITETQQPGQLEWQLILPAPQLFEVAEFRIKENSDTTIENPVHITNLKLWGTGTPPSEGNPL